MKNTRQEEIIRIIRENEIETQFGLIDELKKTGVTCTQATISRDIRKLKLTKELTPRGTYRYIAQQNAEVEDHSVRLKAIFRESVTAFTHAQNIVVIKTLPGLASGACSAIDSMGIKNLAGSLAGDDTAFLAMADSESAAAFVSDIEGMLNTKVKVKEEW
jgi:transcriptional regulator of arginine metabolism